MGGFCQPDSNASPAAADSAVSHDAQNSAPALSNDGTTVYVAAKSATSDDYAYLLGLDSTALTTKYRVLLTDPRNTGFTLLIILAGVPVYWLRGQLYGLRAQRGG